jgi:hypothetical protein
MFPTFLYTRIVVVAPNVYAILAQILMGVAFVSANPLLVAVLISPYRNQSFPDSPNRR